MKVILINFCDRWSSVDWFPSNARRLARKQSDGELNLIIYRLFFLYLKTFSFKLHQEGKQTLPADMRTSCYRAVLGTANQDVFEEFLNLYRSTDLREEKDRISQALGSVGNAVLLQKVIDFAMSDEVRNQDFVLEVASVAANPLGRDLTWEFTKKNWETLSDQFQSGFLLRRLVKAVTEDFATEQMATEIENFFKAYDVPSVERTLQQSIETIKINAKWLQRDTEGIRQFLKDF